MSKLIEELREYVTNGFGVFILDQHEAVTLLAHIERLESNQIPEGFVVVPVEPTPAIYAAGRKFITWTREYHKGRYIYEYFLRPGFWEAVIAAAQSEHHTPN